MLFNQIKLLFQDALFYVVSHLSPYLADPDKDFTRRRKLPPEMLISFLVSLGASSSGNELDDFFDFRPDSPSLSALSQQRDKLKPQALEEVFRQLNVSLSKVENTPNYRLLAADGSSFSFFSSPKWASEEYFVSGGHSAKGFYSVHLNAFYDLNSRTYKDAVIQPVHSKDEFKAFCTMVDRLELQDRFFRIHKGYLVNLSYVDGYSKTEVTLTNGETLLLSKYKYQDFVKAYLHFLKEEAGL